MEQIISSAESARLTGAIEKAATLASLNEDQDRSELLANQLKEAGVDARFAKVASDAFNKRLTVLTFRKTADEHRAEPFQLSDADQVKSLMTGEFETQQKAASLVDENLKFKFESAQPPMQKAASVSGYRRPLYEDTVDYKTFSLHIDSMLDKHAARISELSGMIESLDSRIYEETKELTAYFSKSACTSFDFTTLNNFYGDEFKEAFQDALPPHVDFTKTASAVILPDKEVCRKTAALIRDRHALQDLKDFMQEYGKGLNEFAKTAAAFGNFIQQCEFDGIHKEAAQNFAAQAIRGGALMGLTTVQALEAVRRAGQAAVNTGIGNVRTLYNAGTDNSAAPSAVLDADFLTKDRFRDRMMGWSDMAADPQFSMYPAEQVFQATNKAMETDTSLERPDRRELLRAQVGQLLAQNNRSSTADIAALATTLKALTGAGGSAAGIAAKDVNALDKVTAPDPVQLGHVTDAIPATNAFLAKDYISQYGGQMEAARLQEQKEDEAALAELKKHREQVADRNRAARISAQERYTALKQQAIQDVIKSNHLKYDDARRAYIDDNGTVVSTEDIARMATERMNEAVAMSDAVDSNLTSGIATI